MLRNWIARYYAYQARQHYKRQRYGLCLHYLNGLKKIQPSFLTRPMMAGYLAMCHFQLKQWDHLTSEVERALFLLRRHIQSNPEALLLWQELKSHLADLQYLDGNHHGVKRTGSV